MKSDKLLGERWKAQFNKAGRHVTVTVRCGDADQRAMLGKLTMSQLEATQLENAFLALGAKVTGDVAPSSEEE